MFDDGASTEVHDSGVLGPDAGAVISHSSLALLLQAAVQLPAGVGAAFRQAVRVDDRGWPAHGGGVLHQSCALLEQSALLEHARTHWNVSSCGGCTRCTSSGPVLLASSCRCVVYGTAAGVFVSANVTLVDTQIRELGADAGGDPCGPVLTTVEGAATQLLRISIAGSRLLTRATDSNLTAVDCSVARLPVATEACVASDAMQLSSSRALESAAILAFHCINTTDTVQGGAI